LALHFKGIVTFGLDADRDRKPNHEPDRQWLEQHYLLPLPIVSPHVHTQSLLTGLLAEARRTHTLAMPLLADTCQEGPVQLV